MTKATLFVLAGALALAGCSTKPPPDSSTYVNPSNGLRTDILSENMLETADKTPEVLWLNGARVFAYNGVIRHVVELDYLSTEEHGFLEIPPGQTLTLTIDNEPVKLSGIGSADSRKKTNDSTVTERAIYTVNASLFFRLAHAKKVHVEVRGNKGTVDRWFTAVNFGRINEFVKKFD